MYNQVHIGSIGIDYRGTPNQLNGCVADLNTHQVWAQAFTDPKHRRLVAEQKATYNGISDMVLGLFDGMSEGDLAIITRSGHGTRVPDKSGDEASGFDSAFVPWDYKQNLYLDDQWRVLMQKRKAGTFVLLIDDFCHSGTAARAFNRDAVGVPRYVSFAELVGQGMACCDADRICHQPRAFIRGGLESVDEGIIQFTGCRDDEFSYDASFHGQPNGAMTYFLHRAYGQLSVGATMVDWHRRLTPTYLPKPNQYPQSPQFNGSDAMKAFPVPGKRLATISPVVVPGTVETFEATTSAGRKIRGTIG